MFGMGFGELVLVIIVAIVMIGPKDLPKVLRTAGQWAGKLRRMALDLRVQSGIDDVLRNEGLADDIQEIRKLARGELDGIRQAATVRVDEPATAATAATTPIGADPYANITEATLRHREYPREGADAYNAMPDTAVVYTESLAKSPLARDPLYVTGDASAVLPPEPEPAEVAEVAAADSPAAAAPAAPPAPTAPTDGLLLPSDTATPRES
jgi:sec-independent protein translocase protein TatB